MRTTVSTNPGSKRFAMFTRKQNKITVHIKTENRKHMVNTHTIKCVHTRTHTINDGCPNKRVDGNH